MDIAKILAELRAQRSRIDGAIAAMEALEGTEPRSKVATDDIVKKAGQKVRRTLSPAARRKIAAAQKAHWAAKKATKPEPEAREAAPKKAAAVPVAAAVAAAPKT